MRHIQGTTFTKNPANNFRNLVFKEKIGYTEAKKRGLNVYFSKKKCECGGVVRYTASSSCVLCARKKVKQSLRNKSVDNNFTDKRRNVEDGKDKP